MTSLDIQKAYVGGTEVDKIYLGDEVIYPSTPPEPVYSAMPLTFEIISGGTITWKTNDKTATFNVYPRTIEYSKDGGSTWTSITSASGTNAPSFSVNAGDIIQFRGNNEIYGGLKGAEYSRFVASSTLKFNIYGNLYSLISKDNYTGITSFSTKYALNYLFYENGGLISAKNLMLPATTLATGTYLSLFRDCGSLIEAPELPATTLKESCYSYMFGNCTKLTTAPELPATTLEESCYSQMFYGCNRLNYIKCLATSFGYMSTSSWVYDVRSTGTFVKAASMSSWSTGANGIPAGWTVQDA